MQAMSVRALFFDVFGTLVDFRTGVAREAETILGAAGHKLDWGAFADAWRKEYQPALEEVRAGRMAFRSSTCCTGKISIASCRASGFPGWRRTPRAISISRGIAFPLGPTCREVWPG